MEENKKELTKAELKEEEMENVSGGCIFFHTWRETGNKRKIIESNEESKSYGHYWEYEFKCADCGAIEWRKNH